MTARGTSPGTAQRSTSAGQAGTNAAPVPDGTDEYLALLWGRLNTVVDTERLTQDSMVRLMAVYNDVAHVFYTLEARQDHAELERLHSWRRRFHDNPELDDRILRLLLALSCPDPDAEEARLEYVDQLRRARSLDRAGLARAEGLLTEALSLLGQVREDQRHLLGRLGVADQAARPQLLFYKLTGQADSAATRAKLTAAWRAVGKRHQGPLAEAVDRLIEERRAQSAGEGHTSVLARTLRRARAGESDIETFLHDFLRRAMSGAATLETQTAQAVEVDGPPLDHFAYALRRLTLGARIPSFDLDECLRYVFAVARAALGLELSRTSTEAGGIIEVSARAGGRPAGSLTLDLWDAPHKTVGANHTHGVRNRTAWPGLEQLPAAYVTCRFQRDPRQPGRITFQNLLSLLHEFGHAANHLLIEGRLSFRAGLEYLPPERLEFLSLWFEKWAYHPELARFLSLPGDDVRALDRCRHITMLEYRRSYVERGALALLDFEVHRRGRGTLRETYQRLDEEFGISRHVALGDLLEYFTQPMLLASPGANFHYLWGSADSCARYAPYHALPLAEVEIRPELRRSLGDSFDLDAPSAIPDSGTVFAFFDRSDLEGIA
ncbi:M3 family metallopeptidase [Streptomyces nymphaeiformis]|uniref:Oligopeptidase A n=1 Tax=Streptomyces nymphaeiformis TaxID=2663842 RepID=A0A7W7TYG0_9ACTN|nr:M3 family metallopeptidase [Streptomyces nymphaeiformis]MBB4981697.1 oligopeptidase A [Streptomyces nymphaeiformis]